MLQTMGKADRVRAKRKAEQARRNVQPNEPRMTGIDASSERPPEEVFDAQACPVDDHCAGCGATRNLRAMISYFGPDEVACATVCSTCDGTSMLHLSEVGIGGISRRIAAHAQHRA